jgi:cellulose synthase/poly-beta-1,6-N-acetylglucosamine synthase-like glycosyltransferase
MNLGNFENMTPFWIWLLFVLFCFVTAIQLYYYWGIFSKLAFLKQKISISRKNQPVSVVICARDEAINLQNNLPAVLNQRYAFPHEVILVNDNSLDESKYILEELQKDFPLLNVIELKQEAKFIPGKKYPLSMGIRSAKHDIVLLTDADCIPASDQWIAKMQEPFNEDIQIVLSYGAYAKHNSFLNKIIRFETFHAAIQFLSYALNKMPYMGVGRNLAYNKSLFYQYKGFSSHNHISSGDDDLFINTAANKTNTAVVIDPEAFTYSVPPESFAKWYRQKTRHFSTAVHYKPIHQFLLGLYTLTNFLFYPLFIVCLIFFNWKIVASIALIRLITQSIIMYKTMSRLNEKDLFLWFIVMDILMFFYYILFFPALIRKPKPGWN